MNGIADWIKVIAAGIGGIAAYLWGAWDALIIALVCVVVIDYVTGVVKAALSHTLNSAIGFKGLFKKVLIFLLVAMATIIDRAVPAANNAIRSTVIVFYIANEGLSILENAAEMGLPLPKILKSMLEKMKEKESAEIEEPEQK